MNLLPIVFFQVRWVISVFSLFVNMSTIYVLHILWLDGNTCNNEVIHMYYLIIFIYVQLFVLVPNPYKHGSYFECS